MRTRRVDTAPHKRKTVEIIAALRTGSPMTASQLRAKCNVAECNVISTLKLLRDYGLIRFAGWGPRSPTGGMYPATWEWV